jgi:hypothetical protein
MYPLFVDGSVSYLPISVMIKKDAIPALPQKEMGFCNGAETRESLQR